MSTISELAKDIKEIYEEVLVLQKSMEKKDVDIDFKKINAIASKNPIKNHYISKLDEYTQRVYFTYLSKIIELTNDENAKYSQQLFLSRLIASIKNPSFDVKEILLSSLSNNIELGEFVKCISDELLDVFIVDNLILAYINGNAENQVIEYISEIVSLFRINNDKFKELIHLAKSILNKDDKGIIDCSYLTDLNKFLCYMKNPLDGLVVYTIEDAIEENVEKIFIVNAAIKNYKEVINLDLIKAKNISFINCNFKKIVGINSENKVVNFKSSTFTNIYSNELIFIKMKNCYIDNCLFENCTIKEALIEIKEKGELLNSQFKNLSTKNRDFGLPLLSLYSVNVDNCLVANIYGTTSIMRLLDGCLNKTRFFNCRSVYLTRNFGDGYNRAILKVHNSVVHDCEFKECSVHSKTYTLENAYIVSMRSSTQSECKFIDCGCKKEVYHEI